ncbi:uncharacterized protein LOC130692103 [Daphnia carinata]|uniref:uncharacterized protein LOC130692103 n=1 Tax=Daphnia carinata TaxID=120202 RepID=UPI00257E6930|nr:uncharacterized protein LOC130692103 [Daphnia carinata]XP_057371160.1 uncharacterized protein LOC130692103 [Daphnia carinata]
MLKWIAAPKGNNPPTVSPSRSNKTSNTIDNSPLPWLTDDPLATLNVNTILLDTKRTWKSAALRRQSEPEQIYSVTRMNPLFVDSPKDVMMIKLTEGEKRLMDDSRSSNRSEQCQTPSSSGYESAVDADKRRPNGTNAPNHKHQVNPSSQQGQHYQVDNQRRHYQQHLVESSPASDYRRQFVLGPRLDRSPPSKKATTADGVAAAGLIPRRIGKANLVHQDSLYVTRIHMPSVAGANKPNSTGTDEASKQRPIAVVDEWDEDDEHAHISNDHPSTSHRTIPHPVWPSKSAAIAGRRGCKAATSAIVQQNENYVTKILIAPQTDDHADGRVAFADDEDRGGLDSIVTHSLLVMTSYDGQSTDDSASDSAHANRQQYNKEDLCRNQKMTPAELSEIRQLSQTISQSRVVATVSRALSKNSDASTSCSGSTPEVYVSYPASPASKNEDESATIGSSIARRISMMKERWDKSSRSQLLTESDDDDPFFNRRLDQVYVPENGDVNFSVGNKQPQMTINDRRINGGELYCPGASPFSYLAGMYHPTTITEEATTNDNEVLVAVTPNRMCMPSHQTSYGDPFEHDRLSNSSSRSSGSRRVTFSADTVDNEQSTKSSISTASANSSVGSISGSTTSDNHKTSNHCPDIIEELKLNPHYLPHRYQQQQSASSVNAGVDARSGRLVGYYSYNLQAQLDNYNRNAKDGAEKVSTWEHYHQQEATKASSSATGRPSAAIRLDPYNNLQLHPNYGAACQERSMCVDFTLDGVEEALLQRRSDSHKLRRRVCCCLLLLLCLVVLVIVVIVISLYLSQGQMIFGSLGPV